MIEATKNIEANTKKLNHQIAGLDAVDVIKWSVTNFTDKVFCLSSFGVDSAVMFNLMKQAGVIDKISVITIDTGFLFKETAEFRDEMIKKFGLNVKVFGPPDKKLIDEITKDRLWETNKPKYQQITKVSILKDAIKKLDAKALIAGVRSDQTDVRKNLETIQPGQFGEVRIHPILKWSQSDVEDYIVKNNLPKHPLYNQGYGSVGDWTTTVKGTGRSGRDGECGIHCELKDLPFDVSKYIKPKVTD